MRVVAHLDPVVLEDELLSRVERDHDESGRTGTLIITPTARLAAHLQRRLADRRAAWLNLEVLNLAGLADRILLAGGGTIPRRCSRRLLEGLLRRQVEQHGDNTWSRFVRRRPGALPALQEAVTDLREAAISPRRLVEAAPDDATRALAALYGGYCRELDRLQNAGWGDEAVRVGAALPHAAAFARGVGQLFLHGTYELIGIQLELVRALGRSAPLTVLLPAACGRPVSGYAEEFAKRFLLEGQGRIEALPTPGCHSGRPDLAALYDEEHRPTPPATTEFGGRHGQGAAAEIRAAVRDALREIAAGCPPHEVAIVTGTLRPYSSALEEALDDEGLAWTSSVKSSLGRQPAARDVMLLLQTVTEGFPRAATVELLASPRIDWRSLNGLDRPLYTARLDRWSREARLIGGIDEWTEDLERWAATSSRTRAVSDAAADEAERRRKEARVATARDVGATLKGLTRALEPERSRTWAAHAGALRELIRRVFVVKESSSAATALGAAQALLDDIERLQTLIGDAREVSIAEFRDELVAGLRGSELALAGEDRGGIRVLDAMQARGLTFRQVHLVGMNASVFPRPPREDPILPDTVRRRLTARSGRPIALKTRGHLEQRLLLASMLGAASRRIVVSWQRADEAGRAVNPSLALREVARIFMGGPDLAALQRSARHLPSHPLHALDAQAEEPGLLSPDEARLRDALSVGGTETLDALAERYPELDAGLRMIRSTESFARLDGTYDGRVGAVDSEEEVAVSTLERLGSCPLRHFFHDVLRVRELEPPAAPFAVEAREWGLSVHALLESLYGTLAREGLFDADRERLRRRAAELLEGAGDRLLGDLGTRIARRLPLLWSRISRSWTRAIGDFLEADLARMDEEGWRPVAVEEIVRGEVELGRGQRLALRGRIDRRLIREGAVRIGDYKTGDVAGAAEVKSMLRGHRLQVPLYAALYGETSAMPVQVELLRIGPGHDPASPENRRLFDGFANDELEQGWRETLRQLLALRRRGVFPLNPDPRRCSWCPHVLACRRNHPPTLLREQLSTDSRPFLAVQKKTVTRPGLPPRLDGVDGAAANDEAAR